MKLSDRLEDVLAKGETDAVMRERSTFGYSRSYLVAKVTLAVAAGLFIWYMVLPGSGSLSRLIAVAAGLCFFGVALGVMKGLRRIEIDDTTLHVVYGDGRRRSWALGNLDLRNAERERAWFGSVTVRIRQGGGLAFRLPRDFPGWRRVIEIIGSSRDVAVR